ncbi:MAG TPA: hypothetical protein VI854_02350 [Acidimicrobiia bacterium]|nr:hypothetical protein [Acidimicrobiia bacterium]
MISRQWWSRTGLSLVLVTGALVGATSQALGEEAETAAAEGGAGECVVNYAAFGRAAVVAAGLEVPYPNLSGGPYVETELNAIPKAYALGSGAHEGFLGEVVLGTSGLYPENPSQAVAHFPPIEGGETKSQKQSGPFNSSAESGPGVARAMAAAFGGGSEAAGLGPSRAEAATTFTGKILSGRDEVVGYDLRLGDARINMLRSVVEYKTDGTEAGTTGTWKLEFFGIHRAGASEGAFTGDGIVLQGGGAQPGPAGREQFNAGVAQLSDALHQAGAGRFELSVQPGRINVAAGDVDARGAGFFVRAQPEVSNGTTLHAVSLGFGHTERTARLELGSCDASVESSGTGA